MKITIIHCSFIYTGGGERIALKHYEYFKKRGYDVECFAPVIDTQACFPDVIKSYNIKTFLPQLPRFVPFRHAIILLLTCVFAPFFTYRFKSTDVFIGENQPGVWIAYVLSKILNKPYYVYLNQPNRVLYPRSVDVEFGWRATVRDYHLLFHLLQSTKPLLSFLDRISVVSSRSLLVNGGYIGEIIGKVYEKSVIDAPAGAEVYGYYDDVYEGGIVVGKHTISKPYALITNRHDPQKRFDYVIEAMQYVVKSVPHALLVIPGEFTEHTGVLQKKVKELLLEEQVLFLGSVSQTELQNLYKNACVYCYPSPDEDYGLGPLEAGGFGVPTVAWNHGGPTVTVKNGVTGYLCTPYDVSEYASRMMELFNNKVLRNEMGKAAFNRTKDELSWDRHMDVLEKELVNRN